MAETTQDNKSSKKLLIILIIIIVLLLAAVGVVLALFLGKEKPEDNQTSDNGGIIQYEGGVVNFDDIQEKYDEAQRKANEGSVGVSYVPSAVSEDGVHFTCDIDNPVSNARDMYLNIYTDTTYEEQILLTGLIPPGSGIREFESEIPLDPGTYETVLVMTLVEDDHSTLHSQTQVVYRLTVKQE